jgi:Tfp pilus assembly PilM family ATPase
MNVMLIAAPREMVESRIEVVERTGLEAVSIDIEAFALQRSLVDCNRTQYNDGALRAFVDMGASHTEVTLLIGTQFGLTRSINISGDTFTDAIKNQLRLDVGEAERRKTEVDLNFSAEPGSAPDTQSVEVPRASRAFWTSCCGKSVAPSTSTSPSSRKPPSRSRSPRSFSPAATLSLAALPPT